MKAVFWHADSHRPDALAVDESYRSMIRDFVKHLKSHGIEVVHLTTKDHKAYSENCIRYHLNPFEVVASREEAFCDFLGNAGEDTYWFTEPDTRIIRAIPPLKTDCAMLYRENDDVPMTPSWRLATIKALPFFIELRNAMRKDKRKDWHGDSVAFNHVFKDMGSPTKETIYKGVSIEMRRYLDYAKNGVYTSHAVGHARKQELMRKTLS